MKKKKFTPEKIAAILKEYDNGKDLQTIVRENGISRATFYNWRKRYEGMDTKSLKRLKELEQENTKLKHMYAEVSLDLMVAKEIIEKKL